MKQKSRNSGKKNIQSKARKDTLNTAARKSPVSGKKPSSERGRGDAAPKRDESSTRTTEPEGSNLTGQPTSNLFPPEVPDAMQRVALSVGQLLAKRCGSQEQFEKGLQRIWEFIKGWNEVPKHPDYPQMVQQLQGVLLGHGGHRVVVIPARPDPHMKEILEFGKVIRPERIRKHRGKRSRCHQNVAKLYLAGKKYRGAQIATGYGMSEDGTWRPHSWLVRGDEIIETTVPRTLYFGRVFPDEAALAFCMSQGWVE